MNQNNNISVNFKQESFDSDAPTIVNNPKEEDDAIVLDEDIMNAAYGGDVTEEGMPDANNLANDIIEVLEYISLDEVHAIKKLDYEAYEMMVKDKFPLFYLRYYGVFTILIEGKVDIDHLTHIISVIDEVKQGNICLEEAKHKVDDNLSTKFVYPNLNKGQLKTVKQYKKNERKKFRKNKAR
jgi:hypothetical protein